MESKIIKLAVAEIEKTEVDKTKERLSATITKMTLATKSQINAYTNKIETLEQVDLVEAEMLLKEAKADFAIGKYNLKIEDSLSTFLDRRYRLEMRITDAENKVEHVKHQITENEEALAKLKAVAADLAEQE